MGKSKIDIAICTACEAHTNLNTWAAVERLLTGGMLYGPDTEHEMAKRVIGIAQREQHKWLRRHENAIDKVKEATHG